MRVRVPTPLDFLLDKQPSLQIFLILGDPASLLRDRLLPISTDTAVVERICIPA